MTLLLLLIRRTITYSSEKHFNRCGMKVFTNATNPQFSQKYMMCFFLIPIAGFLHHPNGTCSDSSGIVEEPNSVFPLQEVELSPTSSSYSLALQTSQLSKRKAAWCTGKKIRLRDLESTSWCCHKLHTQRPSHITSFLCALVSLPCEHCNTWQGQW